MLPAVTRGGFYIPYTWWLQPYPEICGAAAAGGLEADRRVLEDERLGGGHSLAAHRLEEAFRRGLRRADVRSREDSVHAVRKP